MNFNLEIGNYGLRYQSKLELGLVTKNLLADGGAHHG